MFVWTDSTWAACGVSKTDGVLAALSGGADSVALLLGLIELQKNGRIARLTAAHLHHGIRKTEADQDEAFCKALCASLGIPIRTERVDVPALAARDGVSEELAARNARYAFLSRIKRENGLDVIALGHHRDDQAETLLMHLLRGSGTDGLAGMRLRVDDRIRPLLRTGKDEILAYLAERGQPYRTDSTNLVPDATRNRIRLSVMPALETVNPSAKRALAGAAERIAEDADYRAALADRAFAECGANREALLKLERPIRLRVLKRILNAPDYTSNDLGRLDALLCGQTGDTATLSNGVTAWLDAKELRIGIPKQPSYCVALPEEGAVRLEGGTLTVEQVDSAIFPCGAFDAYADADAIVGKTFARTPQAGDRFTPLGMQNERLLSDCFTDRKVPRFLRSRPVVCDERGILFVTGYTVDERMRVTAQTKHIRHYHYEED
jgi:tRNA(Ile)-lysidine synthase